MKGDQMGILAPRPTQRELPLSNWMRFKTIPLLTVEEADQALGAPEYRLSCTGTVRLARSQPVALAARKYAESAGRPGAGGRIDQGWLKSCALLTSPPDGAGLCRAWLRERLAGTAAYRARSST